MSPDGKRIAFVTARVNSLAGPDGKPIAGTGGDFIIIVDIVAGKTVRRAKLPIPASYGGLAWSADGERLFASFGYDSTWGEPSGDHRVKRMISPRRGTIASCKRVPIAD